MNYLTSKEDGLKNINVIHYDINQSNELVVTKHTTNPIALFSIGVSIAPGEEEIAQSVWDKCVENGEVHVRTFENIMGWHRTFHVSKKELEEELKAKGYIK